MTRGGDGEPASDAPDGGHQDAATAEDVRAGVDEAGKGPVLGSMFAACVVADPADLPDDVGDSKGLSPERREELATVIRDRATAVEVAEIPVERIDDPATDMNTLTVEAHAEALEPLASDGLATYLDAGDTNAVRFECRVADRLGSDLDLRAEHEADETYPIVGAASIVAKVARDAHIDALAAKYGELGSGYPGDRTTRDFLESSLEDRGDFPPCVRESWQTARDVRARVNQAALDDY